MWRWVFHISAALSLLLFLVSGTLWLRSSFAADSLHWGASASYVTWHIVSGRGRFVLMRFDIDRSIHLSPIVVPIKSPYRCGSLSNFDGAYADYFPAPSSPAPPATYRSTPIDDHTAILSIETVEVPTVKYRFGFLGFLAESSSDFLGKSTAVSISYLWILVLSAPLPAAWYLWRRRTRQQRMKGHCPACGYDLRASKERCPECGRAIPASNGGSAGVQGFGRSA
jgi:hypothetical protein